MSVLVSIEPGQLQVAPGGEASLVLRVRNRGTIVDRFDLTVVGPTSGWVQVDPPSLRLFPDQEGEARITFRPPRAPSPAADTYPFGVSIRAAADPDATTVEEGRITVDPFVVLTTAIVPQTSRGSRGGNHEVTVHNLGNSVAEVSVGASDPDRLMTFAVTPGRVGLKPDASATIRARAIPKDTFFTGTPKRIPFIVQVDEPSAGSQQVAATLEQRPILPSWLKPLAGLAVAALAAILVLPKVLGFEVPFLPWTAIASPTPIITPAPTAAPTEAPPATEGPPPTSGPTPEPTPGPPDTFVWAGLDGSLNGDMSLGLKCQKGDQTCADQAWVRIQLILGNLQNKASGVLLTSFQDTAPGTVPLMTGTLPVILEWNSPRFPYQSSNGDKGLTDRIAIDVAPYIGSGPATVTIGLPGTITAYIATPEDSKQLFEILYTYTAPVPTPAPTPDGGITAVYPIDPNLTIGTTLLREVPFYQLSVP
jgi:hypothetical protein